MHASNVTATTQQAHPAVVVAASQSGVQRAVQRTANITLCEPVFDYSAASNKQPAIPDNWFNPNKSFHAHRCTGSFTSSYAEPCYYCRLIPVQTTAS
jgi:hypothetical protein